MRPVYFPYMRGVIMFEIIKVYKQDIEPLRFIGKKYDNADRTTGAFEVKPKWSKWFENGWFADIENQMSVSAGEIYEDGDAYIGLLRNKGGEPFQYWIGMFTPVNTKIPDGFDYIDFPKSELGVCWVYGKEKDVSMNKGLDIFNQCNEKLKNEGMSHIHDKDNTCWAFERYACPRYTTPDEKGNVIIDICFFMNFLY